MRQQEMERMQQAHVPRHDHPHPHAAWQMRIPEVGLPEPHLQACQFLTRVDSQSLQVFNDY